MTVVMASHCRIKVLCVSHKARNLSRVWRDAPAAWTSFPNRTMWPWILCSSSATAWDGVGTASTASSG